MGHGRLFHGSWIVLVAASALLVGLAVMAPSARAFSGSWGGPDPYGYYYIDTGMGGPALSMVDLNTSTVLPTVTDEATLTSVALPFSFQFYNQSVSNVYISDNGFLTFSPQANTWQDTAVPTSTQPNHMVAGFWDDLDPLPANHTGEVRYKTVGSFPFRTFIVEWASVRHWGSMMPVGGMITDPSPDGSICRYDLDGPGSISGDAFFLDPFGTDSTVKTGDIYLVSALGHAAGTLASGADFANGVECHPYSIAYGDTDLNGVYDAGDYVWIGFNNDTSSFFQGSTSAGDWWIRATTTSGGAAGTLVHVGDADALSYAGSPALPGAEFAWDDADSSGAFNSADSAYITSKAIASGDYVPDQSVRLHNATSAFGSRVTQGDPDIVNMQIKLLEGSNDIEVHWATAEPYGGGLHTVGIENLTGTAGLQYERAATALGGKAVRFTKTSPLTTSITPATPVGWQTSRSPTTYTLTCKQPFASSNPCVGATERVYYDGNLIASGTTDASGVFAFTLSPAADGTHTLTWGATQTGYPDEYTNVRTLQFDTVNPSSWANMTCPSMGSNNLCLTDVTVKGEGSDATSGVASVVCQLDGATVACGSQTVSTDGYHHWWVNTTDNAGRLGSAVSVPGVDKTAPSLSLSPSCAFAGTNNWCRGNIGVTAAYSDSNGITSAICSDNNVTYSCASTHTISTDGDHYIQAEVIDASGRKTNQTTLLHKDATNPVVSLTANCGASTGWCTGDITFTLSRSDATSGLGSMVCTDNNLTPVASCNSFTTSVEGPHYVQMNVFDNAGNVANTTLFRGRDTVFPLAWSNLTCVPTSAPIDTGCSGMVQLDAAASDATSGVATLACALDGSPVSCTSTIATTGNHRFYANATDRANQMTSSAKFFVIDSTAPVAAFSQTCTVAGSNAPWCRGTMNFGAWVNDSESGIKTGPTCTLDSVSTPCTSSTNVNGIHTLAVSGTSYANTNTAASSTISVDSVPPVIFFGASCAQPGNGSWCRGDIALTITATDATSGVASIVCTLDGSAFPCTGSSITTDGTHTVSITATDVAGNSITDAKSESRDATPPTASFSTSCASPGNAGWCRSASYSFSTAQSDALSGLASGEPHCYLDGAAVACSGTVSGEGAHALLLTAADLAGNTMQSTLSLAIDSIAPSPGSAWQCINSNGWCRSAATVLDLASDATSGILSESCTLDGSAHSCPTFTFSTEGTHTFVRSVTDVAGNSASSSLPVNIDLTAPSVSTSEVCGASIVRTWCPSTDEPRATATDGGSGVMTLTCTWDGASHACSGVAEGVDGTHTFAATATDVAGNSATATRTFKIDRTSPLAASGQSCGLAGQNGWCRGSVTVTNGSSDATSGLSSVTCTDNGASVGCDGPVVISANGAHSFVRTAQDVAGNAAATTITFQIDSSAPTPTITTTCNGATGNGWCGVSMHVATSASDATSGSPATTCTLDGASHSCAAYDLAADGPHDIGLTATDAAGNSASASAHVQVDVVRAQNWINATCSFALQAGWCRSDAPVTGESSDAESGVASRACALDGATVPCATTVTTTGPHTFRLTSTDAVGNANTSTSTVNVDESLPTAALDGGCAGHQQSGYCRDTTRAYAWTVTDTGSGPDNAHTTCTVDGQNAPCTGTLSGEGAHALAISTSDIAGNPASASGSLSIDSIHPSVTLTVTCSDVRASGWCRAPSYSYAASASDATSGVQSLSCTAVSAIPCTGTINAPGRYTLVATATDVAGNVFSQTVPFGIDTSVPSLTAQAIQSAGSIQLDWTVPGQVATISSYRLERAADDSQTSWIIVHEGPETTFTDVGLRADTPFTYRVTSFGEAGPSDISPVATARTLGLPGAPTHLTATPATTGPHLTWEAPVDTGRAPLTGYTVYRRDGSGVTPEDAIDVAPDQTSLDDTPPTGVKALGTIVYTVVARNAAGTSERSNEATFTYASQQPTVQDPRQPVSSALPFQRDWADTQTPAGATETAKTVLTSADGLTLYQVGTRATSLDQDFLVRGRNAVTGAITWTRQWSSSASSLDRAYAATLSPDGTIIFVTGSAGGGYGTLALRASDGAVLWSRTITFAGGNSIARAVQATDTAVVVTGSVPGTGGTDIMTVAMAPATGADLWSIRYATPGADDATTMVLANGNVYVGATSQDDLLSIGYRASDGVLAWAAHRAGTAATERLAGLAVAGSHLVVTGTRSGGASDDIITFAYDLQSGTQTWTATYDSTPLLAADARADEAAAIANSTDGTKVFVVGRSTGPTGNGRDATAIAYDASTGARLWTAALDSGVGADDEALAVAPAKDDLRVYVVGTSAGDLGVWALTTAGGAVAWNDTFAHAGHDAARAVAVATDGRLYTTGDVGGSSTSSSEIIAYGPVALQPVQNPPSAFTVHAAPATEVSASTTSADTLLSPTVPRRS